MSTPQQADPPPPQEPAAPPEPQPVLNPLTRAAIFLVVAISKGGEPAARDLLGDLAALQRSVGFRAPDDTLACVAGVGIAGLGPAVRRAAADRAAPLP